MIRAILASLVVLACWSDSPAADWSSWRGPRHTGFADEPGPVKSWSVDGENLLWKSPEGGRTTPIILGDRLYFNGPVGEGEGLQERVICLDANTGKTLWEHRFNVFLTTIVEQRVGWSAMVGDPATGHVYVHGTGGEMICLTRDGAVKWKVSLTENFGRISGYGGRLHTPILDGDYVIINFASSSWGKQARPLQRYLALDKHNGQVAWWAAPGKKPIDATTYSTPVIAVVGGRKQMIAGNGDGHIYGMDARTGEKLWWFNFSKRGINTTVVVDRDRVYATHSEENIGRTEMGSIACIDAKQRGDLTTSGRVWQIFEVGVGYSSPAIARDRLYVVDNSANLIALCAKTGIEYWRHNIGRVGKASPTVTSDGIIYVGEQNGTFHILKDAGDRCEQLDKDEFDRDDGLVDEIYGSAAVVGGRVYFTTRYGTYALGTQGKPRPNPNPPASQPIDQAAYSGQRFLQVTPGELTASAGRETPLYVELFRDGRVAVDPDNIKWALKGIAGTISADGVLTLEPGTPFGAGYVTATLGDLTAEARVRLQPRMPIEEDFEDIELGKVPAGWVGVAGKTKIVERDGTRVLQKLAEKTSVPFTRIRGYMTAPLRSGYTVHADMLGEPKGERNRPDMGLINSRYLFIMLGNYQKLRLISWSPEPRIRKDIKFAWDTNQWYTTKFQVVPDGDTAIVRAKVWPRGEQEPEAWSIEMVDPFPNREGSPGVYGYSTGTTETEHGTPIFYDNIKVTQ